MFPRTGIGNTPWAVVRRIQEYSCRSLTHQSDILNGILGILRAFETSEHAIHHCWGVPVASDLRKIVHSGLGLGQPIPWAPAGGFLVGLSWSVAEPSIRRPEFPSWSWTGWNGRVIWEMQEHSQHVLTVDPELELSIEICDGRVLKWDEFLQSYHELNRQSRLTCFIHITAWTIPIRALKRTTPRTYRIYLKISRALGRTTSRIHGIALEARIDLLDKSYLHWRFALTTSKPLTNQLCIGVFLHRVVSFSDDFPNVMVVRTMKGRTERVGLGWLSQESAKCYGLDRVEQDWFKSSLPYAGLPVSRQELRLG